MAKVTGIGGIFFKSRNKGSELASWYQKNLGLNLENWGGAILKWPDDKAEDGGLTVWNAADNDTKWFSPSESSFMINYRVDNLDELLDQLKQNGVEIVSGPGIARKRKICMDHGPGQQQGRALGTDELGREE
ncbi:MAG: VOC family protein [Acidobacteriota bacterium]